jgi:hypothetical protein
MWRQKRAAKPRRSVWFIRKDLGASRRVSLTTLPAKLCCHPISAVKPGEMGRAQQPNLVSIASRSTRSLALTMSGFTINKFVTLLYLWTVLMGVTSCDRKRELTVWSAQVPSPDLQWIASADTIQNGGFGSGSISTNVYLARAASRGSPIEVLTFSCDGPMPRPYVLDNVANKGGSIGLTMKWITPSHLHVVYEDHPQLAFLAVKLAGIDITTENGSEHARD